jgi:hypothetical protein
VAGAGGQISNGGSGGAAGQIGGGGSGGASSGILLTPTSTGFVSNTTSGVVGGWFAFGDGVGPDGTPTNSDCVSVGGFAPSQCSQITSPMPIQPFRPDASTGAMCTSGTAAKVIPRTGTATIDYADLWGAGIGLYFNNPLGSASTKVPFNLSQYTGLSFDFSGTVIPAGKIRVLFPFMGQINGTDSNGNPPYWAANAADDHSTLLGSAAPAHNVVKWGNVLGPYYLTQQTPPSNPPAFDASMAYGIQFQVFTNSTAPTPYAFCINNLTLLTD